MVRTAGRIDGCTALRLTAPLQTESAVLVELPTTKLRGSAIDRGDAVLGEMDEGRLSIFRGDDRAIDEFAANHQRRKRLFQPLRPHPRPHPHAPAHNPPPP